MSKTLTIDARMIASSGIGMVITHIVTHLSDYLEGWRIALIGNQEKIHALLPHTEHQIIACGAPIYSIKEQWELLKAIPKQTDLLWCPHYVIPLGYRGKLAVTVHDVCHLAWPEYREALHKKLYASLMMKAVALKADAVITDSDFTSREAEKYTSINAEKVTRIYCGVDDSWKQIESPHKEAQPYMLFVGNVKPHKNLLRLLEAFDAIKDDIPHHLKIVGRKEGFIHNDEQVAAYAQQLQGRVEFTGFVSDAELKQITANADFLVMPSLYEGFGLPPLEAMAAGVPVLCSDAASLPEVCGDAALMMNAWDVQEMAAKIKQIALDEALKENLKEKGKQQAELFHWQEAAKAYADIFKRIVG